MSLPNSSVPFSVITPAHQYYSTHTEAYRKDLDQLSQPKFYAVLSVDTSGKLVERWGISLMRLIDSIWALCKGYTIEKAAKEFISEAKEILDPGEYNDSIGTKIQKIAIRARIQIMEVPPVEIASEKQTEEKPQSLSSPTSLDATQSASNPHEGIRAQQTKESGIVKNYFFQSEVFKKIAATCKNEAQYATVVAVCCRMLSLIQKPSDEPIVYEELQKIDFSHWPLAWRFGPITDKEITLGIHILEKITDKKFSDDLISDANDIAFAYIQRTETFFHGTNLHSVKQIKKQGLLRQKQSFEKDIQIIEKIAMAVFGKNSSLFGYYQNQFARNIFSLGKIGAVYVTGIPANAYHYVKISPEWFYFFIKNLKGHPSTEPDPSSTELNPFHTDSRNYDTAKEIMENWISKYKDRLSEQDQNDIRGFFEKYWGLYAKPYGVMLCMRLNLLKANNSKTRYQELISETQKIEKKNSLSCSLLRKVLEKHFEKLHRHQDTAYRDRDITPTELKYFKFPFFSNLSSSK